MTTPLTQINMTTQKAMKWDDNDRGRVTVKYGLLSCYCFTDDPLYFSAATAQFSHMDGTRAVFRDAGGHYAVSRRNFRSVRELKRLAMTL